ncbi:MAG: family transcriptional regulator, cyclic receptor protein [Actinomycetota bacterium]|nr:family transcriptional regulator, cyclic receptor protein [Actinomycetota bacterium]
MLRDVLALTAGLPEHSLASGDILFPEGAAASSVFVLVEGELVIEAGGVVLNRHSAPGSFVGEIGALLQQNRSASVMAAAPTIVREIGDPDHFFATNPQIGLEVARQLAARLDRLTAYVVDVQRQFADRDDHLGVFGEVLSRIGARPPIDIEPGSDRSPDY